MIRLPPDITHDDVRLWLGDTMFMMKVKNKWTPVYWENMGDDGYITASLPDGLRVRGHYKSCAAFSPLLGSVQVGPYAVHITTAPRRQARRSLVPAHLTLHTPMLPQLRRRGIMVDRHAAVNALTVPREYPTYDEAVRRIVSGEAVSVALSPSLIVGGDVSGKRQFFRYGGLVAWVWAGMLTPLYPDEDISDVREFHKEGV